VIPVLRSLWPFGARLLWAFGLLLVSCVVVACRNAASSELRQDPLGGVSLTDQEGAPLRVEAYQGKVLVLNFVFTSCPVVCPRQTRGLAEVQRTLPAEVRDRVRFLSVSVDPEHDTPAALKRFALDQGVNLRQWSFARGSEAGTRSLTERLAVFDARRAGGSPAEHTTAIYLFDSRGRLMQRYAGMLSDPPRLAREIQQVDRLSHSGA
jgi:protein SCO1/2